MKLSIIIPVYNEEKTLEKIIQRVQRVNLGKIQKELIIVNDFSKDSTQLIIHQLKKQYSNIISVEHIKNRGKGAAIRTGLNLASGEIITIQDGDLEYNPEDYRKLIQPILENRAKVVYGSRLLGKVTGFNVPLHHLGNNFLSFLTRLLYNNKITDMETCYKVMSAEVIKKIKLQANRFDIEPEITAKILKRGYKIIEIPITYNGRTFAEGKKINWRDGIIAVYTLFKYRFFN